MGYWRQQTHDSPNRFILWAWVLWFLSLWVVMLTNRHPSNWWMITGWILTVLLVASTKWEPRKRKEKPKPKPFKVKVQKLFKIKVTAEPEEEKEKTEEDIDDIEEDTIVIEDDEE